MKPESIRNVERLFAGWSEADMVEFAVLVTERLPQTVNASVLATAFKGALREQLATWMVEDYARRGA